MHPPFGLRRFGTMRGTWPIIFFFRLQHPPERPRVMKIRLFDPPKIFLQLPFRQMFSHVSWATFPETPGFVFVPGLMVGVASVCSLFALFPVLCIVSWHWRVFPSDQEYFSISCCLLPVNEVHLSFPQCPYLDHPFHPARLAFPGFWRNRYAFPPTCHPCSGVLLRSFFFPPKVPY